MAFVWARGCAWAVPTRAGHIRLQALRPKQVSACRHFVTGLYSQSKKFRDNILIQQIFTLSTGKEPPLMPAVSEAGSGSNPVSVWNKYQLLRMIHHWYTVAMACTRRGGQAAAVRLVELVER